MMQGSAAPSMVSADDLDLEHHEMVAIKIFMNEGASPLDIAQAHRKEGYLVQDDLNTLAGRIAHGRQYGVNLQKILPVYLHLGKSYHHYLDTILGMSREKVIKAMQAAGLCFSSHAMVLH
jgi:hypothetical protein